MKTRLLILLCLLFGFPAFSAEVVTATITVTNPAVTGDTLVINASTRTWTNAVSSSTILTNLVDKNASATNLYNALSSYPFSGPLVLRWSLTNQITLRSTVGGALAGSLGGTWGTLTLSTQSGPQTYTALWPMDNIVGATNRTNQGSAFVFGLGIYSTNAFPTNATALSNHITKGASPPQSITSELRLSGNLNNGTGNLSTSNLVNSGNALRSDGIGVNSLQLGSNAVSAGLRSVAIGNSAYATNDEATAIGYAATATNKSVALGASAVAGSTAVALGRQASALYEASTAIGNATIVAGGSGTAVGHAAESATNATSVGRLSQANAEASVSLGYSANVDTASIKGIAIGSEATVATGHNTVVIGAGSSSTYSNSVVIGNGAATTSTNQVRLGTSSETVSIPGVLYVTGTITNATTRGTNTVNAVEVFTPTANSSVGNGYNSAVELGAAFVRITGPSAAYTNAGFNSANKMDGKRHLVQFDNPGLSVTILHDSALDSGPTNRIYTGTGALLSSTNNPAFLDLIYDNNVTRWRVISFR